MRFVYQHEVESGWLSTPACLGGSVLLRGSSSSGEMEPPAVLETSEFLLPGDAMVNGHLFQPGRSASTKHVGFDVLLKTASKNYVPSPERKSASSCGVRLLAARMTGRSLQGLDFISIFLSGCLCKF